MPPVRPDAGRRQLAQLVRHAAVPLHQEVGEAALQYGRWINEIQPTVQRPEGSHRIQVAQPLVIAQEIRPKIQHAAHRDGIADVHDARPGKIVFPHHADPGNIDDDYIPVTAVPGHGIRDVVVQTTVQVLLVVDAQRLEARQRRAG